MGERFALFVLCLVTNAICYGILQVFGRKWWSFYFLFKPCSTLAYGRAFCAFRFYFSFEFPDLPHMNERDLLFFLCLAPVAYLFESLQKLGRKWWGAYFRFVFCSALEINEPPPLFYAQLPFLKIGSIVPSGNTPSMSISPLPTMKSSCVIDTLIPFASNSSSDNSLPPSKHVGYAAPTAM